MLRSYWLALVALCFNLVCMPASFATADDTPSVTVVQESTQNGTTPPANSAAENVAPELTVEAVAAMARKSVVLISHTSRDGRSEGIGTGFVISADGLIATNLHVIGESRQIAVRSSGGTSYKVIDVHATQRAADLAVIRVDARDLPALELAESDSVKPGESVVAIGNPFGLQNSVVGGVMSGIREIDGLKMIQLAIPVEQGNSGGPVLDRHGKVRGILTLKSAVTENLGFAVAVSALKPLLDKPNPIPMVRWLTIGALNPREWTPLFGANWRQRAGRIHVDGAGRGFGGRSLCLWNRELPPFPFEVAVSIRLSQEDGAAGLVFHSDGAEKHYGFYPSSGKMRLSRFDGPDVFSWQVLEEVDSPLYRPGEWNRLKVRVEKGKILCYLNDHLVIESTDSGLTSGAVGLAKFRHTQADFKNFEVAREIPSQLPAPEAVERVTDLVKDIPTDAPPAASLVERLLADTPTNAAILRDRARHLEGQAARLRELAKSLYQKSVQDELIKLLDEEDEKIDLTRAALLVAKLDNDDLDVDAYIRAVDRMAADVRNELNADADETARLNALNDYLFKELGFHGNRSEYYTRANSYLNEVIDDREGLPITLCVLYMELARRIGLTMEGVGLPGHFVVRFVPDNGGESRLIDVFEKGSILSQEQAGALVRATSGATLKEQHLRPKSKRAIILRMLVNLEGVAREEFDAGRLLLYVDSIVRLQPESSEYRWLRALLEYQADHPAEALLDVDWLLDRQPLGIDLGEVRRLRQVLDEQSHPRALQVTK